MQHTVRVAKKGEFRSRQLVNVAYGAARSSLGKSLSVLFAAIAKEAKQRVGEFNA